MTKKTAKKTAVKASKRRANVIRGSRGKAPGSDGASTETPPAGVPPLLCGRVEGPFLARGWACCACREKLGVAVYNGAKRRVCKECGHKRCPGAMKRDWPEGKIGVPMDSPEGAAVARGARFIPPAKDEDNLFTNILRALGLGLGAGAPSSKPVPPEKDPRWQKACDEIVAAFASAQLEVSPLGVKEPNVESLAKHVKNDLPRAVEIFGSHPVSAPPCKCRHYAIIAAGAERAAEATGTNFKELMKHGSDVLERYLASRS